MGASASLLTDKLDEASLQQLCGDLYTESVFSFLKGADNTVDRVQFLQIAMDVVEQEVFHLFALFCPDGRMDEISCKVFFRNAKLLTKKDFPVAKAGELFQSFLTEGSTTITYPTLRFEVLPKVADIKEMSLDKLLLRFSRSDEPVKDAVKEEGQRLIDSVNRHAEFSPEEELARIKVSQSLSQSVSECVSECAEDNNVSRAYFLIRTLFIYLRVCPHVYRRPWLCSTPPAPARPGRSSRDSRS
jgi:hypothetical protein